MIGALFTPEKILGTFCIVAAVAAIIMKENQAGRNWLAEKFGTKWQEKIALRFLGIPLILAGLLMYFPDHVGIDLLKLAICYVAYIFYRMWESKKDPKVKKADEETA